MTFNNDNRPKLTAIKTPGDYVVKVCRIRDEDISTTQKGDAKSLAAKKRPDEWFG